MATEIFKICHLKNNIIDIIDVFNNSKELKQFTYNDIQTTPEVFDGIFDTEERENIIKNNIQIRFQPFFIHIDDTIEIIKKKIIATSNMAFEEIYLFASYLSKINLKNIYERLTLNEKEINKEIMINFLLNSNQEELIDKLPKKDFFTYTDLLELDIDNKEVLINMSIGQTISDTFEFLVNPYNTISFVYSDYLQDMIKTTNKSILLSNFINSNKIYKNSIYLCPIINLSSFLEKISDVIDNNIIKLYYPYLSQKGISSIAEVIQQQPILKSQSLELIDSNFERNIDNVNLFYNLFNTRKEELNYSSKGILNFNILIEPDIFYSLPLDTIFKIIHASKEIPFIKYNPSKRMENIYRLYTNNISTTGKKIPFLNKSLIFKLIKQIGKTKSVSLYIDKTFNGENIPITCTFNPNASINISANFTKPFSISEINELIINNVNPVISIVKSHMEQTGYSVPLFKDLYDENTQVNDIDYGLSINIEQTIDIPKIIGCLSSIFTIEQGNLKKGIKMRFKKVSNFSEMDSIEIFVLDLYKEEASPLEIINALISNFSITEAEAKEKVSEILRSAEVVKTLYRSKQIKSDKNP